MPVPPIDLAGPLDQVVGILTTAGIRCSIDPGDLNPPAVLVQLGGFQAYTMGGWLVTAGLVLVVPENGVARSRDALAALFNQVTAAGITPDGPVVARTRTLPEGGAPLPSLEFPLNLNP